MNSENPIMVIRKAFNWSQERTAEVFNVNQATISRWEKEGVPKFGPVQKIASGLVKKAIRKSPKQSA